MYNRAGKKGEKPTEPEHETKHIYKYNQNEQKQQLQRQNWKTSPTYFTDVKISSVALIKMVSHACQGGDIEVMGLLQGKIENTTMIVMDVFALPVEGTETRVNAHHEANEFMVQYLENSKHVNRPENAVGWYHSHPGYGCWLSGIDVSTQKLNQTYQEPWLAIVVDPKRTVSSGRVDIGAFRTYPEGKKTKGDEKNKLEVVPGAKKADFDAHSEMYYELDISYFKSSLDNAMLNSITGTSYQSIFDEIDFSKDTSHVNEKIYELVKSLSANLSTFSSLQNIDSNFSFAKTQRTADKLMQVSSDHIKKSVSEIVQNEIF